MKTALLLANEAKAHGEIPVGAAVVKDGKIIGRGRNKTAETKSPSAHAEIIAINEAAKSIGDWRLDGCTLYVTLEPCPMCAGAILSARISTVVFGAYDTAGGAATAQSPVNLFSAGYSHSPEVFGGIMEKECKEMISSFFSKRRGLS